MLLRRGDTLECPQCGAVVRMLHGTDWPPLQTGQFHCVCGAEYRLLQSGSESVDDARSPDDLNKILEAEEREKNKLLRAQGA